MITITLRINLNNFQYKGYDTKVSMSPIVSLWYRIYQQHTPNIDAMCILSDIRKKKK